MRKRRSEKIYELIEEFGEDIIENCIQCYLGDYDEWSTSPIKSIEDLKNLNDEGLNKLKKDAQEYLDETTLNDEEREGWNDYMEYSNKD